MFNPNEHMMKLKGKDYLQVMWRLVWFREDKPLWNIDTILLEADADHAVFKAIITDENGVQKSAGHGSESKRDFGDFLEKAETKAVGRALAMLGYGTQFTAQELDEGERIVDSPVQRTVQKPAESPERLECTRAHKCCKVRTLRVLRNRLRPFASCRHLHTESVPQAVCAQGAAGRLDRQASAIAACLF